MSAADRHRRQRDTASDRPDDPHETRLARRNQPQGRAERVRPPAFPPDSVGIWAEKQIRCNGGDIAGYPRQNAADPDDDCRGRGLSAAEGAHHLRDGGAPADPVQPRHRQASVLAPGDRRLDRGEHRNAAAAARPRPPPIYAGSSEPLLEWALRQSGSGLAVLIGGSRRGLELIARGEALLAGAHLLDAETGTYNLPQIGALLPQGDIVAIHWAERTQGLLMAAGNPLGIGSLRDVAERRVRLARRGEGSGSHQLLGDPAGPGRPASRRPGLAGARGRNPGGSRSDDRDRRGGLWARHPRRGGRARLLAALERRGASTL